MCTNTSLCILLGLDNMDILKIDIVFENDSINEAYLRFKNTSAG